MPYTSKNIQVQRKNFLSAEILNIKADTWHEAGKILAQSTQKDIQTVLNKKKNSPESRKSLILAEKLLKNLESLHKKRIFYIQGIDWLDRYYEFFTGFCTGVHITKEDGALLQSEIDVGCQTVIIKNLSSKQIDFLHIEEDEEDTDLYLLHEKLEQYERNKKLKQDSELKNLYHYKLVHLIVKDTEIEFFYYPGLCSLGATFAINYGKSSFIAADSLFTSNEIRPHTLWANAMVSMIADAGSHEITNKILTILDENKISIFNGYALQLIEKKSLKICSYELARDVHERVELSPFDNKEYISYTNYPYHKSLRDHDACVRQKKPSTWSVYQEQVQLSILRRHAQLCRLPQKYIFSRNPQTTIKSLMKLISNPKGDVFMEAGTGTYVGFINPSVAAHCVGTFSEKNAIIYIGKLLPPQNREKQYYRFYNPKYPDSMKCMIKNLKDFALLKMKKVKL